MTDFEYHEQLTAAYEILANRFVPGSTCEHCPFHRILDEDDRIEEGCLALDAIDASLSSYYVRYSNAHIDDEWWMNDPVSSRDELLGGI